MFGGLSEERRAGQANRVNQARCDAQLVRAGIVAMDQQVAHVAERPRRGPGPAPGSYHPASRPQLPWGWWAGNPRYSLYMLRELSSLFVALWSVRCLVQ